MLEFVDSIWLFISAIIAMLVLGVIAGFSPTLYITQIGISTSARRARSLMIALMFGVLIGIILLSILFQFFQLETLQNIIDSTFRALFVSVVFNIIIGAAFIVGGYWYIHKKPNRIDEDKKVTAKSGYWALVSLGFFRTFVSISGATAIYLGSGIISDTRVGIFSRVVLTGVFLVAALAPFVLILVTMKRHPAKIQAALSWFKKHLTRFNYKLVIGAVAIMVGGAIIIFKLSHLFQLVCLGVRVHKALGLSGKHPILGRQQFPLYHQSAHRTRSPHDQ
ncbi:MAG: hypothetical protein WAQ27_01400 [Candidatus Microsaccharimonas sp.]